MGVWRPRACPVCGGSIRAASTAWSPGTSRDRRPRWRSSSARATSTAVAPATGLLQRRSRLADVPRLRPVRPVGQLQHSGLPTLRPWLKFDVFNLFDNRKLIAWNTAVTQNAASPKDSLGLATDYTKAATYGTATGNTVTNLYSTTINAYPRGVQRGDPRWPHVPHRDRIPLLIHEHPGRPEGRPH